MLFLDKSIYNSNIGMDQVIKCEKTKGGDIRVETMYLDDQYFYISKRKLKKNIDFVEAYKDPEKYISIIRLYHKDILSIRLFGLDMEVKGYSKQDNKDYSIHTKIAKDSLLDFIQSITSKANYKFVTKEKINHNKVAEKLIGVILFSVIAILVYTGFEFDDSSSGGGKERLFTWIISMLIEQFGRSMIFFLSLLGILYFAEKTVAAIKKRETELKAYPL
ncbi:hypothetical protein N6H18_09840 [Reichenbachiella agarivorans]|uniref:YokE-like PH domain-containing protein n=1 Tax=Reichenbachiella agarivorans TaxID=2979464 RepID=A0ABY6CKP1_9BACT|nr:hypothetical protein [Reichenbachiella agarivorans]UXP30655.1 hypothetical protein N6H18_09840 [Reichenbachiella agarivorans]